MAAALGAAGLAVSSVVVEDALPAPPPAGEVRRPVAAVPVAQPVAQPVATTVRRPARARPVALTIGAVGLAMPVRPVGATADGQVALPPDPAVLGWYRYGPSAGPGARGSAVLAGHLDSVRFGVGPLVALRDVATGDAVGVGLSDGRTRRFVVSRVDRYDRHQALPAALFARVGPHRLRVVTCGGSYRPEAGGYQQNLVVTAVPAVRGGAG